MTVLHARLYKLLQCSNNKSLVFVTIVTCFLSTYLIYSQNIKFYSNEYVVEVSKQENTTDVVYRMSTTMTSVAHNTRRLRIVGRMPMRGGRLGNDMFIYASVVGIADTNGMEPVYRSSQLEGVFEVIAALNAYPETITRTATEYSAFRQDPSLANLASSRTGNVLVTGWLQSFKYFQHCEDRIRQEFTFKSPYRDVAEAVLRSIASKYSRSNGRVVFVAVHIRRADMLDDYNVAKGFTVADQAYLERAVSYMIDKIRPASTTTIVYVVSSDGLDWATRHFKLAVDAATRGKSHVTVDYVTNSSVPTTTSSHAKSSESSTTPTLMSSLNLTVRAPDVDNSSKIVIVYSVGYSGEMDLAILSKCNHTIMTVGTYGWWAGFLAGGITTYYKNFPSQNSFLSSMFSKEEFFPSDWVAL